MAPADPQAPRPPSVLITGCSSGIGYAAAHALARRGWRVVATARRQADVERLAAAGFTAALPLDLRDSGSIRAAASMRSRKARWAFSRKRLAMGPATPLTLGPEAVAAKLIRALEDPRPKPRYYVTLPTYLIAALRRGLPTRWLDRALLRMTAAERRG
ncbi:SDR family NAD(P)-dependent oxidoreductase [Halorhodospira neutriphila]|uniref:Short-chain dehydrogenase/reductase SDR n=1 Tax=Halorhodospira neutriphila TaxID=168379 RepID=A0ABS1E8A5_9GAMM|nr:SDR family NAD(P)-dependent oxidoreductase [Halorhodospira neutriphila]MBK1727399.1 hypothetical protein [Halorhodospira neutriphila]